ncbi:hypothetical protein HPB51_014513 [Rhipicephalus microplus]|uniref:Uncharacterized protein n=1 Tax=Rhipicephalus microplus TaxID=6941 RepID=A0A9J6EH97_RHIMP|nr:hypothetical protein HPB51_014513 [Rhipicephalus microplus]
MRRIGATLHHTVSVQAFHESRRSVVKPFDEPAELPSRCAARTRAGPPRRNAATYPAASCEATAKEAAANSVSLAGRAARRRRQKQCAHFPRPCPSGVDEKHSYRKNYLLLLHPYGNASQQKKAGHFYGGQPLLFPLSRAHRSTASLSLSLRVTGNQSLERRKRRKRPSPAAPTANPLYSDMPQCMQSTTSRHKAQ